MREKKLVTKHLLKTCLILLVLILSGCEEKQAKKERNDFKKYYDQFQVDGSFILFDENNNFTIFYNKEQLKQQFSPASTFKILNSLIGLETGVIKDEEFIIPWDSIVRNPVWDKDHDLKSAFSNSVVWYYQELARRVGEEQMIFWINKANYGNKDISGSIDSFWLTGGLLISPEQQLEFLRRLHANSLPFSKRSTEIVKKIMVVKDTLDYKISAKTGWGGHGSKDIGWFIGYVEVKSKGYFFVNCVQSESDKLNDVENAKRFDQARKEIVYLILNDLDIIKD